MRTVRLESEIDFEGWRKAARALRAGEKPPGEVLWTVERALFDDGESPLHADGHPRGADGFSVPREFVELANLVVLHRSAERFDLLYRLLWRLGREPNLMHIASDPEVARARDFAKAVSRASHKMKAFVRFRLVEAPGEPETHVAWFEPAHRVTELTAPFFVRRFAGMRFSILTPDSCAHWDGEQLSFTPGADPADAPREDALEEFWRTYYASIFNPARLKVKAMQKEMPKRYWRNLPEAALIPELIASAEARTAQMVAAKPTTPNRRVVRAEPRAREVETGVPPTSLDQIAKGVDACRRCELYKDATQGVPGEGAAQARLMFVGEQPGDQEDLAGRPFVGPAGQMFDKALAEADVPRIETFVTNAVKHFRHEMRGKRRLHKTPGAGHVEACRWWLDSERRIVRPRVIVALGSTAALGVFGRPMAIGKSRQQAFQLEDQAQGVVTYHPSYLLRLPDADAKAKAYEAFVEDLVFAWKLAA